MSELLDEPELDAATSAGRGSDIVRVHRLVYLDEGDEVTVGRPDTGSFVVLPSDGAALLRKLESGMTIPAAEAWYAQTYGEPLDVADFVADLDGLGFIQQPGEAETLIAPVRWQRLGAAVFSPVVGVLYVALLAAWLTVTIREPQLRPRPHNLIFTHYMSVLVLVLFFGQMPLMLLHETAHALAGRRLGLRSKLSIGRRLQFVVFETSMDGLVAVPRNKRYLPILAGMLTDIGVCAALSLLAFLLRRPNGPLTTAGTIALALAYLTLMRVVWQFWFFLRTDIFYLVVTVLGCVDLHTTAKQRLANFFDTIRRKPPAYDPRQWHPRDRAVSRWYSVLMAVGYAASIATIVLGLLPAIVHILVTVVLRLAGNGAQGWAGVIDSVTFFVLNSVELVLVAGIALRQRTLLARHRRQPAAAPPPIASPTPVESGSPS